MFHNFFWFKSAATTQSTEREHIDTIFRMYDIQVNLR